MNEFLEENLIIGTKIKIGKEYAEYTGKSFQEGQIIELVEGFFEHDQCNDEHIKADEVHKLIDNYKSVVRDNKIQNLLDGI